MKLTPRERKISAVLAEWDPEGLIEKDKANEDEYDGEARAIFDQIHKRSSVDEIAEAMSAAFYAAFRTDDDDSSRNKKVAKQYAPKNLVSQAKKIAKILASKTEEIEEEPEEDVLDWDATVETPPPKQKGEIKVNLVPKEPSKPIFD